MKPEGDDDFGGHLDTDQMKAAAEAREREQTADSVRTRASLLVRLRNSEDQQSWNSFVKIYGNFLSAAAHHAGLTEVEVEEAVQETVIAVSKAIADFRYDPERGRFRDWLLRIMRCRILDQFRKRGPQQHIFSEIEGREARSLREDQELSYGSRAHKTNDMESLSVAPELEEIWKKEFQIALLQAAIERVRHRVSAKQFQLFDLRVLQEWPMERMKSALNVSAARIYLAKQRVTAAVKKELKHLQRNNF